MSTTVTNEAGSGATNQPEITYPVVTVDNSTSGLIVTTSTNEDGSATTITDKGGDDILVVHTDAEGNVTGSTQYPVTTVSDDDGVQTTKVTYYDGRSESATNNADGTITYTSVSADGTETISTVQPQSEHTAEMQGFATSTNALVLKSIEDANKSFTKILDQGSEFSKAAMHNSFIPEPKSSFFDEILSELRGKDGPKNKPGSGESESSFNTHEMMRIMQSILSTISDELKQTKEHNIEAAKNQQQNDIEEHLDNIQKQIREMEKAAKKQDFFGALMAGVAVIGAALAVAAAVICPNPLTIAGAVVATAMAVDACVAQATGSPSFMDRAQSEFASMLEDAGCSAEAAQWLATALIAVCVIAATVGPAVAKSVVGAVAKAVTKAVASEVAKQAAQGAAKQAAKETLKTVAKEAGKDAAEEALKTSAEAAATKAIQSALKKAGKELSDEAIETIAKEAAEGATKQVMSEAAKAAMKGGADAAKGSMNKAIASFVLDAFDAAMNISAGAAVTVEMNKANEDVSNAEQDVIGSDASLQMNEERLQDGVNAFTSHYALEKAITNLMTQTLDGESKLMFEKLL